MRRRMTFAEIEDCESTICQASTFPGLGRRRDGIGTSSNLKSKANINLANDDDFYSSLAAEMGEESDVSDADVGKMLADMDDMDDALFGSSMKSRPGSTAAKEKSAKQSPTKTKEKEKVMSEHTQELDKTLEDELFKAMSPREGSPTMSPRRSNKPKAGPKKFDFGEFDEDDPLAGLLSDDDDEGPKKSTKKKPQERPKPEPEPEPEPSIPPAKDDLSWTEGTKVKDDQPPQVEASPAKRSRAKSIDFDDDDDDTDILGSLGLEKSAKTGTKDTDPKPKASPASRPARSRSKSEEQTDFGDESDLLGSLGLGVSPREKRRSRPEDSQEAEEARSKVSELFGTSSVNKMLDKPPAGKQRQSQLDKILKKKDTSIGTGPKAKEKEEKDEDFSFGSYTPSSVTSRPGSAPPLVGLSDDDDLAGALDRPRSRANMSAFLDDPVERPKSATSGVTNNKRTGRNSRSSATPSDDWLELAGGN